MPSAATLDAFSIAVNARAEPVDWIGGAALIVLLVTLADACWAGSNLTGLAALCIVALLVTTDALRADARADPAAASSQSRETQAKVERPCSAAGAASFAGGSYMSLAS